MNAATILQNFLDNMFAGQMDEALALVAPNAKFISTRPQPNPHNALHGTFIGPEGAKQLFTLFGTLLEPQAFNIEGPFSQGEHAAFYGNFCHINRKTGKDLVVIGRSFVKYRRVKSRYIICMRIPKLCKNQIVNHLRSNILSSAPLWRIRCECVTVRITLLTGNTLMPSPKNHGYLHIFITTCYKVKLKHETFQCTHCLLIFAYQDLMSVL